VLNGHSYVSKSIARAVEHARTIRPTNDRSAIDLLTHRRREVLQMLAAGKQVMEIAALLNLSPKTVEFHKYRILALLGLRTVAHLTRYTQKSGIVQ
jgi:DNA-binding NarL/FixJ family response regulator